MKMRLQRLKRFAFVLCCVVSLFASPISTCACGHDLQAPETSEHCQPQSQQSHETKAHSHHSPDEAATMAEHHQDDESSDVKAASLSVSEQECCCVKPAPKVYAKSETLKTEKQTAAILPETRLEMALVFAPVVSVKTVYFSRPFYLSDSFYNISPGRAPPRFVKHR